MGRTFKAKQQLLKQFNLDELDLLRGKNCLIYPCIQNPNLCWKIFHSWPVERDAEDVLVNDIPLSDLGKIQNFANLHNLAPKVYNQKKLRFFDNKFYFAQLMDFVKGESTISYDEIYDKVIYLGKLYGFEVVKKDCSSFDVVDNQLVDFGTFKMSENHIEKIKDIYNTHCKYGENVYHPIEEWGITKCPRNNNDRVKWAKLDEINFEGKTVLDIGCAGGFFTRYAKKAKASYVTGVDFRGRGSPDPIHGCRTLAIEFKLWNGLEYVESDITKWNKDNCLKADVVFFLSLNFHVGIPDWLPNCTKDVLIFEDNSKNRDAEKTLKKMFRTVRFVGKALDHGDKPIYWCYV